ncbi:hypothetical protein T4A_2572, partial [Trichinella pseudospiralis]
NGSPEFPVRVFGTRQFPFLSHPDSVLLPTLLGEVVPCRTASQVPSMHSEPYFAMHCQCKADEFPASI